MRALQAAENALYEGRGFSRAVNFTAMPGLRSRRGTACCCCFQ
ncbi:MAG: hypothetical protein QOJ51_3996, partial [Acidobacteriaceae bacterium]|nr:hypothetical protein [Acidobacteriaceae bacterium]